MTWFYSVGDNKLKKQNNHARSFTYFNILFILKKIFIDYCGTIDGVGGK